MGYEPEDDSKFQEKVEDMKMNYHTSDNDGSASAMQGIELEHAAELKAEYERKVLADKFHGRPRVRQHKRCAQELQDHKDFSKISPSGIELAARHIAEVLKKPDAVLIRAYWPDDCLAVVYAEQAQGIEVEGLFKNLPAYADGPIVEDTIYFVDIEFESEEPCCNALTTLGYKPAWAHEIEYLLGGDIRVRVAMEDGLERAILEEAYDSDETAFNFG